MRPCRQDGAPGFTLVEVMTVVTITGVLAVIAIPVFQGYVFKSRTSEATQFLGVIKLRQEAYRAEFGQYAQFGGTPTAIPIANADFAPGDAIVMKDSTSRDFPGSVNTTAWSQLGASPGGPVRFGYAIAAGLPGDAPVGAPYNFTMDHWFVVQAVSDLDDDGQRCLFEAYSQSTNIYYTPAKGWE